MKPPSRLLPFSLFAVFLGTGYLATAAFLDHRAANSAPAAAASASPASATAPRNSRDPGKTLTIDACLELLANASQRKASTGSPLIDQIATWTDDEIRRALNAALKNPDVLLGQGPDSQIVNLLVREWLKRDLTGFTQWLDSVKPAATQKNAARYALNNWPPEKAEQGLAYFLAHPDLYSGDNRNWTFGLASGALNSSAGRGADALAETMKACREAGLSFTSFTYPPGFDYRTFSATDEGKLLWKSNTASGLINAMIRENRDLAYDTIALRNRELGKNYNLYELSLIRAPTTSSSGEILVDPSADPAAQKLAQTERDREQATWLGSKMTNLTEDERNKLMPNIVINMHDPEQLDNFITALPNAADQAVVRREFVRNIQDFGVEAILPSLEALGPPADRIAYLENMPVANSLQTPGEATPPLNTALLTARLTAWQATPEQIAKIIRRIRPGPDR